MPEALSILLQSVRRLAVSTLLSILILVFFIATLIAIELPLMSRAENRFRKSVGAEIPGDFPYLILTPTEEGNHRPWIVFHAQLEAFRRAHPDHTFLVPAGQEQALQAHVLERSRSHSGRSAGEAAFWLASFEIESRRPGRQTLKVVARLDDDDQNIGWYEATDREVVPRFHQAYSGPRLAFGTLGLGLLLNLALWSGGWTAVRIVRRRPESLAGR